MCKCSVQFALRRLPCASGSASCSAQALRELSVSTSHTSVLIEKFHYAAGAVLRALQLYLQVAILQPQLRPRTTLALKSCDFCLEKLPRTRRGSTPRPRDSESSRANHATTSKDHFASNKFARRRSESASTRTILAEGLASIIRIGKTLSFCTSTTPIPAEGSSWNVKIAKKPQVFDLDRTTLHRGSLAQIRFFDLDHANLRRGSRAHRRTRKKSSAFLTSTTRISAEGRSHRSEIIKSPQLFDLDHTNRRRGSRAHRRDRKKFSGFWPRPDESPQRVDFRRALSALPRHPKKRRKEFKTRHE